MDAEQIELLERLARLRDLGAITRSEFQREKEAVLLRASLRPATVHLRVLPAPGRTAAAVAVVDPGPPVLPAPARPRAPAAGPEATLFERIWRHAGWILWTLFSIGGLDALIDRDPLEALSLLVCGLLLSPPFHRLLAIRMALPTRLLVTLLGVITVLEIGAVPPAPAGLAASPPRNAAVVCGEAVSHSALAGGERARERIVRPWRKLWTDLLWARVAGSSVLAEWRAGS